MPQARRTGRAFLWLSWVLLAAGCGDKVTTAPTPGPYGSITITAISDTATIGSTLFFSAAVTDTSGNAVPVPGLRWESSNTAVATIDAQGRLTPRMEGTTSVQASGGGATSNAFTVVVIQGIGWVDQSPANLTLNNLHGVHFYDRLHGWAVGDVGTILATSNAGLTWRRQMANSVETLNAVFFPTASHGFVVGSAGRVLETTNGGTTWNLRTGIPNAGLGQRDVFVLDPTHGWIVGNAGLVMHTSNGGATWSRDTSRTIENLYSVWATAAPGPDTTLWAVGEAGTVVGSVDGGETWTKESSSGTTADLRAVVRRTRDDAFAVGATNVVVMTQNPGGGPVWQLAPSPIGFTDFYGLAWPATSQLMAVGKNTGGTPTILRSQDLGGSWSFQTLPPGVELSNHGLTDVWFVDRNYGWAVGDGGTIVHTATGGM